LLRLLVCADLRFDFRAGAAARERAEAFARGRFV